MLFNNNNNITTLALERVEERHDVEKADNGLQENHPLGGSPEALVRNETLWINCVGAFLIGTLLIVAVGLSLATYKVLARLENDNFQTNFQRIASQIRFNFVDDINTKIWTARQVSYALRKVPSAYGDFFDLDRQVLDDLIFGSRVVRLVSGIQWSPILWNNNEKDEWEAYARDSKREDAKELPSNICYVCGSGMEVGSPFSIIKSDNYGNYPCGLLEKGALQGVVPTTLCDYFTKLTQSGCQCQPVTDDNKNTKPVTNTQVFRLRNGKHANDAGPFPMSPIWKTSPQQADAELYNQMSDPIRKNALLSMIEHKLPTFAETRYPGGEYEHLLNIDAGFPKSALFFPVMGDGIRNETVVGTIALDIVWNYVFGISNKLPWHSQGIVMVIESNVGQKFTFQITDNRFASFVGEGDLHDPAFNAMMVDGKTSDQMKDRILRAAPHSNYGHQIPADAILYNLRIYPSNAFMAQYVTNRPWIYTLVVAFSFVFTASMCLAYDMLVRRRQTKVMHSAEQSNALLTSLFPEFIKSRLMERVDKTSKPNRRSLLPIHFAAPKNQLRTMLGKARRRSSNVYNVSEPIADFFPNVTVIFADIAGFTAWSSEREPTQVFQLLETLYEKFDEIAEKHGVFKIETIGDCYVAVTGLPEPQTNHAARMARFGYDIMTHMHQLVASLESQLGPGTGSLSIRVGLHSGSVTGGVLRGDRSRFQLFGDTMNMASRMQTTGEVNRIQVSEATASLLMDAGHSRWLERRDANVFVKGKGDMRTYWVDPVTNDVDDDHQRMPPNQTIISEHQPSRLARQGSVVLTQDPLVDWNADLLERFLRQVVACRQATRRRQRVKPTDLTFDEIMTEDVTAFRDHRPIDDVTEVITISDVAEHNAWEQLDPESVELDECACKQLREYVKQIASMYRNNPFHNFEHACHVTMSANKIIKRIVRPEDVDLNQDNVKKRHRKNAFARSIHQSTFGISSDALIQFALVFSALIHDVDHSGVSNAQLVREEDDLAVRYQNKSVAEQHSIKVAWDILMEDQYSNLRACIYTSEAEKCRFRQLVVNAVISTDIFDEDLQKLRKKKWNKAFHKSSNEEPFVGYDRVNPKPLALCDDLSHKATVVFEYIIQASDVAHTMQHWHIYSKWNEHLFAEQYRAYLEGREERDPSLGWYQGEISLFDNYIIPLARKLETCGVFGVSSDEYLNYALENRREWELKGRDIVQSLVEKYSQAPPSDAVTFF